MKMSRYLKVVIAIAVFAGVAGGIGGAYAKTRFSYNIPTYDLKNYPWSVRIAVTQWTVSGPEINQILRRFFGLAGGIYSSDAAKYRKTPAGLPSVADQVEMIYLPVNERVLPNGDYLFVSERPSYAPIRRYVVLQSPLNNPKVVLVAITYYYDPPGGYTIQHGRWKGIHDRGEMRPTLVFFYPENSSGVVVPNPYLQSVIIDEVGRFLRAFPELINERGAESIDRLNSGRSLIQRITTVGIKVPTSEKEMMPR